MERRAATGDAPLVIGAWFDVQVTFLLQKVVDLNSRISKLVDPQSRIVKEARLHASNT